MTDPSTPVPSDEALFRVIDAWAHDYANDAWRALSGDEQMAVAARIAAAAAPAEPSRLEHIAQMGAKALGADARAVMKFAREVLAAHLNPRGQR